MRLLIFVFLAFASISNAQTDSLAVLQGVVKDTAGEPFIGATLKVFQNGDFVKGTITDFDGNFKLVLEPGRYDLECSYTGYKSLIEKALNLQSGQVKILSLVMKDEVPTCLLINYYFYPPVISFDPDNTGEIFTASQIRNRY